MLQFFYRLFYGRHKSIGVRGANVVKKFTKASDDLRVLNAEIQTNMTANNELINDLVTKNSELTATHARHENFITNIENLFNPR